MIRKVIRIVIEIGGTCDMFMTWALTVGYHYPRIRYCMSDPEKGHFM